MDGTRRKSREARQLAVGLLLVEEVCVFIHSPYKSIELIYMTSAFVVVLVWCLEEVASMHKRGTWRATHLGNSAPTAN